MARILLAEDDEIMRETLFDRLIKNGWQVDSACDGRHAIKQVEQNYYNLVLSDIRHWAFGKNPAGLAGY